MQINVRQNRHFKYTELPLLYLYAVSYTHLDVYKRQTYFHFLAEQESKKGKDILHITAEHKLIKILKNKTKCVLR